MEEKKHKEMFDTSAGGGCCEEAMISSANKKVIVCRDANTHVGKLRQDSLQLTTTSNKKTKNRNKDQKGGSASFSTQISPHTKLVDPNQQKQAQPELESQRLVLDRMAFSSIHFSASTFVNNVTNSVLFPILLAFKRDAAAGGEVTAVGVQHKLYTDDNEVYNSNGKHSLSMKCGEDYAAVATRLTGALASALAEVERVRAEEERLLDVNKMRCHMVELREKRLLAKIRLGLEGTSARLQEYENRVSNALAATAGIEQHLSQSNARVMRGRSVSQLLRHFKMFTQMNYVELSTLLKSLSRARVEQRVNVTANWESGLVSPVDSMYFGGGYKALQNDGESGVSGCKRNDDGRDVAGLGKGTGSFVGNSSSLRHDRSDGDGYKVRKKNNIVDKQRSPFCKDRVEHYSSVETQGGDVAAVDDVGASGGNCKRGSEGDSCSNSCEKIHKLEAAAIAFGLDRVFVLRSCTEAQVEWCQRLTCLSRELDGIVGGTKNIDLYVDWVRQELENDIFHLVDCFNALYKRHSEATVHRVYGRTILRTLELISRLYTTITPSHDALLSVFYTRVINQMGVMLFSDHSPKPMPVQEALGNSATSLETLSAMQHYHSVIEPDLHFIFNSIISCVRRDVIVVETIFGTTNSARQQLLAQVTEGVVKPFLTQQMKLAEFFERDILEAEARLSPRSKRKAAVRVVDSISYVNTMHVRLLTFFQMYVNELRSTFGKTETDFLNKYIDTIFTGRTAFVERGAELELLRRYHTILEEQYTRDLHLVPDEIFELRDAHFKKTKELIDRFIEVVARTCTYAPPKDVVSSVLEIVRASLDNMGRYMAEELQKSIISLRADRDNWRVKPKSEEELLRPSKLESQQCGMNMLLFVQSCLMNLNDAISTSCAVLLQSDFRFESAVEEAKEAAFATLDERAEILLNMCANAIIVRSLSILVHYQKRNDYMPKVTKVAEEAPAQPCTRACTLFCLYITRQFEEAKEFIRLSNGQLPQRLVVLRASGTCARSKKLLGACQSTMLENLQHKKALNDDSANLHDAVRARARAMSMQQLLHGDGGPSSFARTVGVCLYRGIVTHLKTFVVNDRGALIYKQDVTAYMEAMGPIVRTPGLGGAVVEVLFCLLKETASLLLMPWEHIKEVRDTGLLRLMSNEEKLQFIKMREDLRSMPRKCTD